MPAPGVKLRRPPDTKNFSIAKEQYGGRPDTAVFDRSVGLEAPEDAIKGLVKFVHREDS